MRKKIDFGVAANIAVIGLVAYALLRPAGPLGERIVRWQQDRKFVAATLNDWPRIAQGSRLDTLTREVAFVEFSDYECPFCRKQHKPMDGILRSANGAGVAFRHLPLTIHATADGAARTAICAERQGRFREMHERLMTTDLWLRDTNWVREAAAAGVADVAAFSACRTDSTTTLRLANDVKTAEELGIHGTPTFVYRGGRHNGVIQESTFVRLSRSGTR